MDSLGSPYKELIQIQIRHFIVIQTKHQVETSLILKNDTRRLSRISRTDDRVQLLYIHPVTGDLGTIVVYDQLRQPHRLLHDHIGGSRYLLHEKRSFLRLLIKLRHILSI